MENLALYLSGPVRRRRRRLGWLHFLEATALYLQVGYDFSYAWDESLAALKDELPAELALPLTAQYGEGLMARLDRLVEGFPDESQRLWFSVLRELYAQGAGLQDAVLAVAASVRREHERELESHCRELPRRINVWLLIFFLPPTMALLFAPLVGELLTQF